MALTHQQTNTNFGLTVSIAKTKHMVTGRLVTGEDLKSINLESREIKTVDEFQYLGSLIASSGRIDSEVQQRVAKAQRAFRALRKAVFLDKNLRLSTNRMIYMPACCQYCCMGQSAGSLSGWTERNWIHSTTDAPR